MYKADLVLHDRADRHNVKNGITNWDEPSFGHGDTPLIRREVLVRILQLREQAPDLFPAAVFTDLHGFKFDSTRKDNGERFGLGWKMFEMFSAINPDYDEINKMLQMRSAENLEDKRQGSETITPSDVKSLVTVVTEAPTTKAQDDAIKALSLDDHKRNEVALAELVDLVSDVLRASSEAGEASAGAASSGGAASSAGAAPGAGAASSAGTQGAVGASTSAGASAASSTGAASSAGTQGAVGASTSTGTVLAKLAYALTGEATTPATTVINERELEACFYLAQRLIANDDRPLARDYKTGLNVLQQINGIQGEDVEIVAHGLFHKEGKALYIKLLRSLGKGGARKVPHREICRAWKAYVDDLVARAEEESEKQRIRDRYGYVLPHQVHRHAGDVAVRAVQHGLMLPQKDALIDLCRARKERFQGRRAAVYVKARAAPKAPPKTDGSLAAGQYSRGALQPEHKRPSEKREPIDPSRTCFLCWITPDEQGQPRSPESCLKCDEDRKPVNGHAKVPKRKAFVCPVCPSPTDETDETEKEEYQAKEKQAYQAYDRAMLAHRRRKRTKKK